MLSFMRSSGSEGRRRIERSRHMNPVKRNTTRTVVLCSALLAAGCGSPGAKTGGAGASATHKAPTMDVTPTPTPIDSSCTTALGGPYTDSLPVPDQIVAAGDDYSARLQWGGPLTTEDHDNVEGYRVCWGPKGQSPSHGLMTVNRVIQLFGVQPGTTFVAYVQSVDNMGHVSAPAAPVEFGADSSRVDALRQQMTGFFDDFNAPDGPFDEMNWNTAYSWCDDPVVTQTFVTQTHARNLIGNNSHLPGGRPGCDRDQNISRARPIFDFTGREGTITFDFDGSEGERDTWYVSVFPYDGKPTDLIDITTHVTFDPGAGHPGRFLRISQGGNSLMVNRYDAQGNPVSPVKADFAYTHPDVQTVLAVMRHWVIKVSKDHASVSIDGQQIIDVPNLGLDFEKAIVTWDQFSYNPTKAGRPWAGLNFDNFGFDGPRSVPNVHNYKPQLRETDNLDVGWAASGSYQPDKTTTITIPDDISGASAAHLFYTIQNDYRPADADTISINGVAEPIPPVSSPTGITLGNGLTDNIRPFAIVQEISTSKLVTGDNTIAFHADQLRAENLHIEVEFPPGKMPAKFTQPLKYIPGPTLLDLPAIGPTMQVTLFNGKLNTGWSETEDVRKVTPTVSGTVTMGVSLDMFRPVIGSGLNLGISRAELLIDHKVWQTISTQAASPAPNAKNLIFTIDTTKLTNGLHEVWNVGYDSSGQAGRPGYPGGLTTSLDSRPGAEGGSAADDYAPFQINVQN